MDKGSGTTIIAGAISILFFYLADFAGIFLDARYNVVKQAMSELFMFTSPHKIIVVASLLVFCLFHLILALRVASLSGKGASYQGARLMFIMSVFGIFMLLYFPMNPRTMPLTPTGLVHAVLALLLFVTAAFVIHLVGRDRSNGFTTREFRRYSDITLIVVVISELSLLASSVYNEYVFGIFERSTMFLYLQWALSLSYVASGHAREVRIRQYVQSAAVFCLVLLLIYGIIRGQEVYSATTSLVKLL